MMKPDGTEMDRLVLPDREEDTAELNSIDDSDTNSPYKTTVDYALWIASGEDPVIVEQLLDQLEAEISSSMDGVELDSEAAALITDDIRKRLRSDAQQAEESELR